MPQNAHKMKEIMEKGGKRMGMNLVIRPEADFSIHGVLKYSIGGQEVWITTTTIGMVIVSIIILILAFKAKRTMENATDVPGTLGNRNLILI